MPVGTRGRPCVAEIHAVGRRFGPAVREGVSRSGRTASPGDEHPGRRRPATTRPSQSAAGWPSSGSVVAGHDSRDHDADHSHGSGQGADEDRPTGTRNGGQHGHLQHGRQQGAEHDGTHAGVQMGQDLIADSLPFRPPSWSARSRVSWDRLPFTGFVRSTAIRGQALYAAPRNVVRHRLRRSGAAEGPRGAEAGERACRSARCSAARPAGKGDLGPPAASRLPPARLHQVLLTYSSGASSWMLRHETVGCCVTRRVRRRFTVTRAGETHSS